MYAKYYRGKNLKRKLLSVFACLCSLCLALPFTACGQNTTNEDGNGGNHDIGGNQPNEDNSGGNNQGAEPEKSDDGIIFTLSADGGYYAVTGFDFSARKNLSVPSSYKNLPVKEIGKHAFDGCEYLTGIQLPEGIEVIGNSAFNGCTSLAEISIPESVASIGDSAFYDCYALTELSLPASVSKIGSSAMYGCCSLKSITLQEGVTAVANSTFSDCTQLESVTLPRSVTYIGNSDRRMGVQGVQLSRRNYYTRNRRFYRQLGVQRLFQPDRPVRSRKQTERLGELLELVEMPRRVGIRCRLN